MINDIFYAVKRKGTKKDPDGEDFFIDFFNNPQVIFMCVSKEDVYKLKVRPVETGEVSQYWGWHQYKIDKPWPEGQKEEYEMIWPSRVQAEMCFPYGPEAEEKAGKGKLVNFVVEEIERVTSV